VTTVTPLPIRARIDAPASRPPRLQVVVDTEEEFDWSAPYSRANTSVSAMKQIGRAQRIFDRFGLKPAYVVDYPVASQAAGYDPLQEIHQDGRCTIGAHLHPWVSPPYDEELTTRNSFTMNLPVPLQHEKIRILADTIAQRFGRAPQTFKAGRYGIGGDTLGVLKQLGFDADLSVCPRQDFRDQGGPSFSDFDSSPLAFEGGILEIPCTVDYIGWAGPLRPAAHRVAGHRSLKRLRAVGILSRLGVTNQVMLSPEGNTLAEMCALATSLVRRGLRTFTLSFHSPSVEAGHTPYVRTSQDVETFLHALDAFCAYFMTELGGVATTPMDIRNEHMPIVDTSR